MKNKTNQEYWDLVKEIDDYISGNSVWEKYCL